MRVFESYADYYDILYSDKDYEGECDFLESIFHSYSKDTIRSVLDLGCGTGGHALVLGERGYKVTGIDTSTQMLGIGRRKAEKRKVDVELLRGDTRRIDLERRFDVVISMFAVMGYQVTNEDIISAFKTASKHF